MEEPDAQQGLLLSALPLPVVLMDEAARVRWHNPSFERAFRDFAGFPPNELSITLLAFLEERQARQLQGPFNDFLRSDASTAAIETTVKRRSESTIWLRLRFSKLPVLPGGERRILCVADDITPQKLREEGLRSAKEEAERAIDAKSLFVANMSHELRTPIQTISTTLELLEETDLEKEQREYTRQVRFSADILLSLVNDILDISKIEAGKLELESIDFDLASCVWQSAQMIALEAQRKGLELIVDLDPALPFLVRGDPTRLRQVILNLVKNAVKFTKSGQVTVRTRRGESGAGGTVILLEVADTGIGVPEERKDGLFSAFFQTDSSHTRKYGGTGLGLSISRRLVEAMGGRIGMRDNEPEGSVFWFVIPLQVSVEEEPRESPSLSARILIVDDNPDARDLEARIAAQAGLSVVCASSGAEALRMMAKRAAANEAFGLCVIDQDMPVMDGWALGAAIRADPLFSSVRLLLLTREGSLGPDVKARILDSFDGSVTKPARPRELVEAIFRALTAGQAPRQRIGQEPPVLEAAEAPGSNPSVGPAATGAAQEPSEALGARVLVVEDHVVNQQLFKVILEHFGCSVSVASDGQEAVELTRQQSFDLIFMDIQMPRLNGHDATRVIRSEGAGMPIVAVTAASTKEERDGCLASGMNDILLKPFRKEDIHAMLEFWLKRSMAAKHETQEEEPQFAFDDAEVFDAKAVVETFLGKQDLVVSLLSKFLDRTKVQIASIDEAINAGDFEAVKKEAHGIKGSAWNIHARRLGNSAKALEDAAASGDASRAEGAMENLREELFEFAQYAQNFVTAAS